MSRADRRRLDRAMMELDRLYGADVRAAFPDAIPLTAANVERAAALVGVELTERAMNAGAVFFSPAARTFIPLEESGSA